MAQQPSGEASVLVIENTRPSWTSRERLQLSTAARLVFGDTTAPTTRFTQIRGVVVLDNGTIAVMDEGRRELRLFDRAGQWVRSVPHADQATGRPLSTIVMRRLLGDTIGLVALAGVSLFTANGDFVRHVATNDRTTPGARRALMLDLLPDGRRLVAMVPRPQSRAVGSQWVDSLSLRVLPPLASEGADLGTFAYTELTQGAEAPAATWLSPVGAFAVGSDRVYAGFGDRYEIRAFTGDGAPHMTIRRAWTPVPISPDDWETWVVQWSARWVKGTGAARDSAIDLVRSAPYAESLPALAAFLVDRTGRLWVRQAHWQDAIGAGAYTDRPAVPSEWSVFDTSGTWLGDVIMPVDFLPFDIGADYVAGVEVRDRITRVAIYGLQRQSPTR